MSTIEHHQSAASRLKRLGTTQSLPLPAAGEIGSILEAAVGWDGFRMFGVDPATNLINRFLGASENDVDVRNIWLEQVYLSSSTTPYSDLTTVLDHGWIGVAFQEQQEQSWGYPTSALQAVDPETHRRFYHESGTPSGGVLFVGLPSRGRSVASLIGYRRDARRPFTPDDVRVIRELAGIAGQVFAQSLVRERVLSAVSGDSPIDATGVLIIERSGDVQVLTPAGEFWLDVLGQRSAADQSGLPMAVWSAIRGLRSSLPGKTFSMQVDTPVGPVRVEATSADDHGSIAIVLAPVDRTMQFMVPEAWGLTPRQKEMVMMLVTGASNRELAEAMFVSENTVEWHLRQIYQHLEVRSRTHLQSRFFREVLLDGARGTNPGGLTPE